MMKVAMLILLEMVEGTISTTGLQFMDGLRSYHQPFTNPHDTSHIPSNASNAILATFAAIGEPEQGASEYAKKAPPNATALKLRKSSRHKDLHVRRMNGRLQVYHQRLKQA